MKIDKIDIQASIDNLKSFNGKKIADAIDNGNFSAEEIQSINKDIDDLFLQACKTKLSLEMRSLHEESPSLPLRDVVVKMLNLLPEEIKESEISILTDFIMENWKGRSQKKAA